MFERIYTLSVYEKSITEMFCTFVNHVSQMIWISSVCTDTGNLTEHSSLCGFGTPSSGDEPVLSLFIRLQSLFGH